MMEIPPQETGDQSPDKKILIKKALGMKGNSYTATVGDIKEVLLLISLQVQFYYSDNNQ